jgi:hypothetical protein
MGEEAEFSHSELLVTTLSEGQEKVLRHVFGADDA